MCDKCRVIFGASCTAFLERELDRCDDPLEAIEAFTVQSVGSIYARLAQVGVSEEVAKTLHDKVMKTIADMNTRAMRDRAFGANVIPANALLN